MARVTQSIEKRQQNTEKIGWGVEATCTANVFTFEVSEA